MTIHTFIVRLNWRQVVIHFIASWFFIYSFQILAALHNTNLVDIIRQTGKDNLRNALNEKNISASDITEIAIWLSIANTIGSLVASGISLTISIRQKWFWVNSFLVFVLFYVLSWLDLSGWTYLKRIFLKPGELFNNTTLEFLANGLILLTLGLFTFFLPGINRFIAKGNRSTVKSTGVND